MLGICRSLAGTDDNGAPYICPDKDSGPFACHRLHFLLPKAYSGILVKNHQDMIPEACCIGESQSSG